MFPTPAREIAFRILLRVETRASYASELLHSSLTQRLSPEDRALATELVLGVLRWRGQLDFLAEKFSGQATTKLDCEVLVVLRMGLYQLRFLEKIPRHAAVNESVELVKRAGKRSAAGFVNAVLRKVSATPVERLLPLKMTKSERLAILHSHPAWLLERWNRHYGEERALELAKANNLVLTTTLRLMTARAPRERILELLAEDGVECAPGNFLHDAVRVVRGHVTASELFRWGWITIQDEASQMIAYLLGARPGERVLDLCAAPGGKTAQLAEAVGPSGFLVACDLHRARLRQMKPMSEEETTVALVQLDGQRPLPFSNLFDRLLVDVPCSGTGTLARNPEIKWRLRPRDLDRLHRVQVELLHQAAQVLKPGGRLVYSTCSLEPEENELLVDEVLAKESALEVVNPARDLDPHRKPEMPSARLGELFDDRGFFRTLPPTHHTDGFFAAALTKRSD